MWKADATAPSFFGRLNRLPTNRTLHFALTLTLVSCSPARDTPAYFQQVTGIELCEQAEIVSVAPWKDFGVGWEYEAAIKLDAACQEAFFDQLAAEGAVNCGRERYCSTEVRKSDGEDNVYIRADGHLLHVIWGD